MNHLDEERQVLSRRAVLKALTVTGGAAVLSTLPTEWKQPVVKVGALPAFAAVSPTATLAPPPTSTLTPTPGIVTADMDIEYQGLFPGGSAPGYLYLSSINYNDPGGNMVANQARARLTFVFIPSGSVPDKVTEVTLSGADITGSATSGTVRLPIRIDFGNATSVNLTLLLIDATGAENSQGTANIPKPP